jgi:hypothetical protein
MLQFNIYKFPGEPWGFRGYVKKIRNFYSQSDDASLVRLVNRNRDKYKATLRYHLINSRLFMWGIVGTDIGLEARSYAIANYPNLDNYSRHEFLGCLERLNIESSDCFNQFKRLTKGGFELNFLHGNFQAESDKPVSLFKPRKSGFFSVIENIIVALFIAEQDGVVLMLPPEKDWWPYEVSFHQIFGNSLGLKYDKNISLESSIDFDAAREKVAYLGLDDANVFYVHKRKIYNVIYNLVLKYLSGLEIIEQGIPIYFVRAGDKLELETVLPPMNLVEKSLLSVLDKFGSIGIISDDYVHAEKLRLRLNHIGVYNLTSKNCYGHELSTSTSENDVITILKNFVLLRQSPVALSCPSSNLVNAAHWARKSDEQNIFSALNPVEKYLLF